MSYTALRLSVFSVSVWILPRANCHVLTVALLHCISRMRACEHELRILSILTGVVATIPLNDRASKDDSNGGYIIFWSNFDLSCEFRAVDLNSAELGGK